MTSHPIQYQAPWFRALAREIDLTVFFCHRQDPAGQAAAGFGEPFEWDIPLVEGYSHRWLNNVASRPGVESFGGCDTPELAQVLRDGGFGACLVNGWYLKSYIQAVRASRQLGIPVLMRGDSQLGTPRNRLWTAAKHVPYRWFLSSIDAHLYVGVANRRYLRHYGVPESRLFPVLHFIDNDRFAGAAAAAHEQGESRRLREAWKATAATTVVMFVGKLIEKKRPGDFVAAVAMAARSGRDVVGVIVGSGPLEAELRKRVDLDGVPVRFAGFQNQTRIPAFYDAVDCLVLPSDGRETWGLVVNEAMACGCPAIVSDAVGCRADLVTDETGVAYPVGDVSALADAVSAMSERSPVERDEMRRRVRAQITPYSCAAAVRGTVEALAAVTSHASREAS